jgi:hypothetical protein
VIGHPLVAYGAAAAPPPHGVDVDHMASCDKPLSYFVERALFAANVIWINGVGH